LPGDRFLFNLYALKDGATWSGAAAHAGRLRMAGPEVLTNGCPPARLAFTENRTPDAFLAEMMDVINGE
jgi:hypothetical protein